MALNQGKFDKNVVKYQLEVLNVTWTAGIHGFGKENEGSTPQAVKSKIIRWEKVKRIRIFAILGIVLIISIYKGDIFMQEWIRILLEALGFVASLVVGFLGGKTYSIRKINKEKNETKKIERKEENSVSNVGVNVQANGKKSKVKTGDIK